MKIKILDPNVGLPMNIFIIIGNFITVFQNVPQVVKTYKVKSTRDFSAIFLFMRLSACFIWGAYSIEIGSLLMLINNLITLSSTMFISYYKVNEIISYYKARKNENYIEINDTDTDNDYIENNPFNISDNSDNSDNSYNKEIIVSL
jgi:MtN3 and saliva related transmembrane protein